MFMVLWMLHLEVVPDEHSVRREVELTYTNEIEVELGNPQMSLCGSDCTQMCCVMHNGQVQGYQVKS